MIFSFILMYACSQSQMVAIECYCLVSSHQSVRIILGSNNFGNLNFENSISKMRENSERGALLRSLNHPPTPFC